ncbi:MAG TPA: hypothetical protein VFO60_09200 [Candidatus Dormibacteraeota bacterium]|nr:hypothetical protein [Candidatus Dormibacteraeota bacterium]
MTAEALRRGPAGGRAASSAVARVVGRRAARSGAGWGAVFALYVFTSAKGYASAYPDAASRHQLAVSLGTNSGLSALLGTARQIDTVAGFTAWRSLGVLTLVGAVWGLLAGTRLLRGEEDAGRWELLLAGQTTRRRAAGQALAGLGAGWAALLAVTAAGTELSGRSVDPPFAGGDALVLALSLSASAAAFLAIGALTGQLASTRRQAAAIAGMVLGASFLLRVVADAGTSLTWLRWLTPLGWVEEAQPLTGARPAALLPIAALVAIAAMATVRLAGARDAGAGVLPDRDHAPARTRLLGGATGLAVRLALPGAVGWIAATGAGGLLLGLVAKSAADAAAGSSEAQRILGRLGATQSGAAAYLGVAFVIVATLIAFIAAGAVAGAREEEASGRLDTLAVHPLSRASWLLGRLGVACVVLVAAGLATGLLAYAGATAQGAPVGFGAVVAAGISIVPPAMFVLGAGALALAVAPRSAAFVAYGIVAWSFLVELIGSVVDANRVLLDTSLLHHLSAAPAVDPDWGSALWFLGLGAVATVIAAALLERRDLAGD